MTREQLEALKEWVEAAIEYAIQSRVEDSEGYRGACVDERLMEESAWERLVATADDDELSDTTYEHLRLEHNEPA